MNAAQSNDTGQLLRRALDLRSALAMGIRIGMDEIDAEAFFAMQVVEQERDAYDRERMKQRSADSVASRCCVLNALTRTSK